MLQDVGAFLGTPNANPGRLDLLTCVTMHTAFPLLMGSQQLSPGAVAMVVLAGCVFLSVSLAVYGRIAERVRAGQGKVKTEGFAIPDLLVILVLGSWMGAAATQTFLHDEAVREISVRDLVSSAVLFAMIAGGLIAFLKYRNVPAFALFGLRDQAFWPVVGKAAGYLAAAYPPVLLCNVLMQMTLGEEAKKQAIMDYFVDAVEHWNRGSMIATAVIGVCIAPVLEETIFRGYFYGTLRRHFGPLVGIVVNASLFAAIHGNLLGLPALFVLAVCLTLAYEATGTLFVPMAMHAAFNGITLGLTFLGAELQR